MKKAPSARTARPARKRKPWPTTARTRAGEKAKPVAPAAGTGAVIGGLSNGVKGGLIGAGIGGGIGTAIGLFSRGNDVRLEAGTTLEMGIQREVPLDATRIPK